MTFTVEEISLLLEVDHSTRKAAMQALIALLKITKSAELRSQFRKLGGKLYAMSDTDFEDVDFDSWREDFDAENE
jgi:hypothetical protein